MGFLELPLLRHRLRFAFAELAALIAELPLVVTIDTAVAHLAGAFGVETCLALSRHSDWRWQLGRGDTDWYPSMRLFRQKKLDDWPPVIEEIVRYVRNRLTAGSS